MIDVTEIIACIISLIGAVITGLLIPYLYKKIGKLNTDKIIQLCEIACAAVEEMARVGFIPKDSKKDLVKEFMKEHGFTYSDDELEKLIDATCWKLFNKNKDEVKEKPNEISSF